MKNIINIPLRNLNFNKNGVTFYKKDDNIIFIPIRALIFISMILICILVSFIFMSKIRIEKDVKTIFVKGTAAAATAENSETIILYEYVIGNDTLFMNEKQEDRFLRIVKKEMENEAAQVEKIKNELKIKFNIVRSSDFLLAEIRPETRKILFFEVPRHLIEEHAPAILIETKTVKITKPGFIPSQPLLKILPPSGEKLDFGIYTKAQAEAYILKYKALAKEQEKKHGIPASVTLAQGLHESNAGKSRLARNANNHFGIKCFANNCNKGHCQNYTDDSHKDFFRTFKTVEESFEYHSIFLQKTRYKHLLSLKNSEYKKWCEGLQKAGYATDKNYSKKLIATIEKYLKDL
jgi:flagellar basal body-associated protein FliL